MRHLDLFSGLGGFALAAHWMGWQTVQFVEIDSYAQQILAKHWPQVPLHADITTFDGTPFTGTTQILTAGFPCQDVSVIAKDQKGIFGERSGLWWHALRVIEEVEPDWLLIENVPTLRNHGSDLVLADLGRAGYATWPVVVGACHANAPHRRQRVWIIGRREGESAVPTDGAITTDPGCELVEGLMPLGAAPGATGRTGGKFYRPDWEWWTDAPEPGIRLVADGVPRWLVRDRVPALRALGNSVVPQVVLMFYKSIARVDDLLRSTPAT